MTPRAATSGFVRDNLEAFAVAIALALVIRHYCIEAFRIPTASMMPTLLGDHRGQDGSLRHGDRILVDKFVYLWREPRRYEVVVFRYPLNANKNFIKRLIGLPGEWLRIVDGDIWTSTDEGETWQIERKPDGVQEQLFFPYYPQPSEAPGAFQRVRAWKKEGTGWNVNETKRLFDVDAGTEPTTLRFAQKVLPFGESPGSFSTPPFVGDVRVTFELHVERAGQLTILLQEHGRPHRLVLGEDESFAVIAGEEKEVRTPIDVKLRDGMELTVSFANADNALLVSIEGDADATPERLLFPEPKDGQPPIPSDPRFDEDNSYGAHRIALTATGLKASLIDVSVDRDVHYDFVNPNPRREWQIPDERYFVLGDNTGSSKDSRAWNIQEAYLKNGDVIRWEYPAEGVNNPYGGRPPGGDDEELVVAADIDGLTRRIRSGDVEEWETAPWSFVPRENLVGRAFAIFWPIYTPPLYAGRSRVNVIR